MPATQGSAKWAAARSSQRAGKGPELLAFFEKQLQRSPRDMRWAVAVRDLRRFFHDPAADNFKCPDQDGFSAARRTGQHVTFHLNLDCCGSQAQCCR